MPIIVVSCLITNSIKNIAWPFIIVKEKQISTTKGIATRSENLTKIVGMTSKPRKTIVAIASVNDFVQGGHVELFRLVALLSDRSHLKLF